MHTPDHTPEGNERLQDKLIARAQRWLDPEQAATPPEHPDTSEIDDTADIDPVFVEEAG
jgi:hypothetical protein